MVWYWGRKGGGIDFTRRFIQRLLTSIPRENLYLELSSGAEGLSSFEGLASRLFLTQARPRSFIDAFFVIADLARFICRTIRQSPRIVIITMNAPWGWPLLIILRKMIGFKLIYIAHDATPHKGDYAILWQTVTQNGLIKNIDAAITLSDFVTQKLRSKVDCSLIPMQYFFGSPLPARGNFSSPVKCLFVGRLVEYKGLRELADFFRTLPPENFSLTIAGEGPLAAEIPQLYSHIRHLNLQLEWHSDEAIIDLIKSHDVILCPYQDASQSGIVAQALELGTKVAVINSGGLAEQIQQGARGFWLEEITDLVR